GAGRAERGREVGEDHPGIDGGGGQVRAAAGARRGQAVRHAHRGYFLDLGARDGGDGADRARQGEGRGRNRDRGVPRHAEESGDGRGDVPEAVGRGDGGRQRGAAAARDGKRGRGAGPGGVQAGLDHAAQEVQGRGLHPDEGRGRAAHAV